MQAVIIETTATRRKQKPKPKTKKLSRRAELPVRTALMIVYSHMSSSYGEHIAELI